MTLDPEWDFIVLGAGGGLAAALQAQKLGMKTLLLERSEWLGGSTAISGGTLWLPGNRLMNDAGVGDSLDEGRRYLKEIVEAEGPWCGPERIDAFLESGNELVDLLLENKVDLYYADGWADYYAEKPGGLDRGRTLGARPVSREALGEIGKAIRPSAIKLAANSVEVAQLALGLRTLKSTLTMARVGMRQTLAKIRGQELLTRGQSLIGQLARAADSAGATFLLKASVSRLLTNDGRVSGIAVQDGETEQILHARKGVLIATGGYAKNEELRSRLQPDVGAGWSMASPDDQGAGLGLGLAVGADAKKLEESWWVPSTLPGGYAMGHVWDRCFPHSIFVDSRGERFMDEAVPYMEAGQVMIRHGKKMGSMRAWMILESRHRKRYALGMTPPRVTPSEWIESGYLKRAETLEELAVQCELEPNVLKETVERFNQMARQGSDADFGRGSGAFARYYGDPRIRPNPNLGTIEQPPFYAVAIYPGDVGTAGGLLADKHARVLRKDGSVIHGLYAAGNCSAPVFGSVYPGAGASIAASMVFGLRAARHAAEHQETVL